MASMLRAERAATADAVHAARTLEFAERAKATAAVHIKGTHAKASGPQFMVRRPH